MKKLLFALFLFVISNYFVFNLSIHKAYAYTSVEQAKAEAINYAAANNYYFVLCTTPSEHFVWGVFSTKPDKFKIDIITNSLSFTMYDNLKSFNVLLTKDNKSSSTWTNPDLNEINSAISYGYGTNYSTSIIYSNFTVLNSSGSIEHNTDIEDLPEYIKSMNGNNPVLIGFLEYNDINNDKYTYVFHTETPENLLNIKRGLYLDNLGQLNIISKGKQNITVKKFKNEEIISNLVYEIDISTPFTMGNKFDLYTNKLLKDYIFKNKEACYSYLNDGTTTGNNTIYSPPELPTPSNDYIVNTYYNNQPKREDFADGISGDIMFCLNTILYYFGMPIQLIIDALKFAGDKLLVVSNSVKGIITPMTSFLSFLPGPLSNMIALSLAATVLISILKLIRGK